MTQDSRRHVGERGRHRTAVKAATIFTGLITTAGLAAGFAVLPAAAATPLAITNLGYTPLASPVRIADTRSGATDPATYAGKTLTEGTSLTVDIPASANVPANAGAVVVNIAAINPTQAGFLSVYPGGGTNPGTASVNFTKGQTVGNLVTVGLGPDSATGSTQSFTVYDGPSTGGGSVDFTADLMGYYAPQTSTSGGAYVPLTPARIYDSRTGSGQPGAGTTLGAGGTDNVTVTGVAGVPTNATAVALNVAITNATASSYIEAYPTGAAPANPTADQNFVAGETLSSQVIAGVGTNGQVTIRNYAGSTDIVVDVNGYFTAPGGTGSLFNALSTPVRLLDTRTTSPVNGGSSVTATLSGAGATAGVLNVADLAPSTGNFLTVYPAGGSVPLAANVNFVPADTYNVVSNGVYGSAAGGKVAIYNGPSYAGPANVVVDETGYFGPSTAPSASAANLNIAVPSTTVSSISMPASTTGTPSTRTITATVTDGSGGAAVSGDTVLFSISPSTGCGTLTSSTEVTASNGVTPTDTYTAPVYAAGTTAATCTITARDAFYGQTGTGAIDQTAPANTLALTPATSTVSANGVATQTLTATVTPATAGSANNDAVTFTTSGTCGTVSPTSGNTGSANTAVTTTYTASSTPGFCTVTATESNTGASGSATIDQSSVPTPAVGSVTISGTGVATTTAAAAGTPGAYTASQTDGTAATYTATVEDSTGTVIANDPISFAVTPPAAGTTCGTVSPAETTTSSSGTASFTYTAATGTSPATSCVITATEADTTAHSTLTVTQSAPAPTVTVTPASTTVPVGTTDAINVSVSNVSTTSNGNAVTFTVTPISPQTTAGCGAAPAATTLAVPSGSTTGTASSTYTAGGNTGFCTITATVTPTGGTAVSGSTTVDQVG